MKKCVVILGNSGFIGGNLEEKLQHHFKVYGFNSKNCNLLDYNTIKRKLSSIKIDSLVFVSSIARLKDNSIDSLKQNINMALNVAKYIEHYNNVRQVIFFSTIDVYGNVKKTYKENLPLNPIDYYAQSKSISETILKQVCCVNNVKLFIPRLSGVFGKGDKQKSTIYHLVSSAIEKNEIILFGEGKDTRDFIYIDYLADIIINSIHKKFDGILNIATGKNYSIKDISYMICSILKTNIKIVFKDKTVYSRNNNINFDIERLRNSQLIGFNKDLQECINLYIKYFQT